MITTILLVIALICFILASFNAPVPQVNLVAFGLFWATLAFLLGRLIVA